MKSVNLLLVLAVLSGCASLDPQPVYDRVSIEVQQRSGYIVEMPGVVSGQESLSKLLSEPIGLENAVRISLANNTELIAAYQFLGIAQSNLVQAGLMRNPVFDISLQTGGGERILEAGIAVPFLDIFLIPLRKDLAGIELEIAELEVTAIVLNQISKVRAAWIRAISAQELFGLQQSSLEVFEALAELSKAMKTAGNISELNHQQTLIQLSVQKLAVEKARAEAGNRRDQLSELLGIWNSGEQWSLASSLPESTGLTPVDGNFEKMAVDSNLNLAISRKHLETLAVRSGINDRSRLIPDLEAGWSGERENGDWKNGPMLAFALPVFDTGRAGKAAIDHQIEQARQQYVQEAIRVRSSARQAARTMRIHEGALRNLREEFEPYMKASWQEAIRQYNAAQIGIPDLLKIKLEHGALKQRYLNSEADYWLSRETVAAIKHGIHKGVKEAMPPLMPMASTEEH